MHSEIKNIMSALLATVLIPTSYFVVIIGVFYLGPNFNVEGIAIILLGIIMEATGQVFSEQQKQQLTKRQLIKKVYTHIIVGITLIFTAVVFINVFR